MARAHFIRWFHEIGLADLALVGGKNASLGEMFRELSPKGVKIPNGFAITAEGYWSVLRAGRLTEAIRTTLTDLDTRDLADLAERGRKVREMILNTPLPDDLQREIVDAYATLCTEYGPETDVAGRSSATAEDLPTVSFAGQLESFLNIRGERALLEACRQCLASLFTDRALSYRVDEGFDHLAVALSIGVQQMVRSDLGAAGVMFTLDTERASSVVLFNSASRTWRECVKGRVIQMNFSSSNPPSGRAFAPS
jgi:pyruvate,water dikinase